MTLFYSRPVPFIPSTSSDAQVQDYTFGAGHSGTTVIQEADIVTIVAGVLARCATNQAGAIAGFAIAAETATFGGTIVPWTYGAYNAIPWGFSQVGSTLPPNPGQIPVLSFAGLQLDINLRSNTGWVSGGTFQANINTAVGLFLDATTNLFVADPSQTNLVATIIDKPQGPTQGVAGDLAARVRIKFLGSALVGG